MTAEFEGKIALVTGGAAGIGKTCVQGLVESGARVLALDRDQASLEQLVQALGPGVMPWAIDLCHTESLQRGLAERLAALPGLDLIVNNAGVNDKIGLDASPDAFRQSLERNLIPAFAVVQACLPSLMAARGAIVNIASKCAETGQGGTSGYVAAKGGLLALTREWALDLAVHGIRCNAVVPAEVMTPMYRAWLDRQPSPLQSERRIADAVPLGRRFTQPEEIAQAVLFLGSPRSSHITGQWLHVDGGYTHLDRVCTQTSGADRALDVCGDSSPE